MGNDACRLTDTSVLNFGAGQTRSNNGVVHLTRDGRQRFLAMAVVPGGQTDLVIDVTGYLE